MTPSVTQGAFSYLAPLTDEEIRRQIERALRSGWAISIEHTDQPTPGNHLWSMWGLPSFDELAADDTMEELDRCRAVNPDHFVRVNALDCRLGRQTIALSFLTQRPLHA